VVAVTTMQGRTVCIGYGTITVYCTKKAPFIDAELMLY
jgi:hypothetical protein